MGIDYTKRPQTPAQPPVPPPSAPQAPPAYGAPPPPQQHQQQGGNVSLSKLTLTKSAPSVSLSKTGGGGGVLRVNLNWNARPEGQATGGFFKRLAAGASSGAIDLDLGCLYEYADGSKGVVQALGNAFRGQHPLPSGESIIWLDADDRSGTNTGGENLHVDLRHTASIRRIIVFALIYEGVPNWGAADAVVTMFPVSGPQIEVRLDEHDPRARICAVALLENRGGELVVNREVRYINGGQDVLDRQYGWGMNWSPGRK
ncbi:MAG: tellurium resistance protein [Geodermatophilaceae bacterium]|nr:tellurium resistance protein [Geodermatophilaceae bacterium]